jgi:hypothetical protein
MTKIGLRARGGLCFADPSGQARGRCFTSPPDIAIHRTAFSLPLVIIPAFAVASAAGNFFRDSMASARLVGGSRFFR